VLSFDELDKDNNGLTIELRVVLVRISHTGEGNPKWAMEMSVR
jgi:hypothetical protein